MTGGPILVVDDDEDDIRTTLRDILERNRVDVLTASNGHELVAELRRDPALMAIPILLMTATRGLPEQAAALGAVGYLPKPFKGITGTQGTTPERTSAPMFCG